MFNFKLVVKDSAIEGKGVFAGEQIPKDSIVWQFKKGYDFSMSQEEFASLSRERQKHLEKVAYLSPTSGFWIYSPTEDPGNFINHSKEHNLSMRLDSEISSEPYFVANRTIEKGEEVTNNYLEFDEFIKATKPHWAI